MEFFNLVCQEAFAEDAQMFSTNPQTGLSYFRACSLQPLYMYELLGLLMGLAVYNGITLPISLPEVFYALLLLGEMKNPQHDRAWDGLAAEGCIESIKDGWPTESRSMAVIATQDIPGLDCSFPLEANGLRMAVQLEIRTTGSSKPEERILHILSAVPAEGGSQQEIDISSLSWPGWTLVESHDEPALVTPDTKATYVTQQAWWLVQGSVAPQAEAFQRGFYKVVDLHALSLFTPISLKAFMEGSRHLDIDELRSATKYDGYETNSKYINTFWRIVSLWSETKQKQLLKFVTAAERVPMGGASNLTFVIKKTVLEDLEHLPTSSTCFGTLYLPRYANAEVLEAKLSLAIEYGLEGFGTG